MQFGLCSVGAEFVCERVGSNLQRLVDSFVKDTEHCFLVEWVEDRLSRDKVLRCEVERRFEDGVNGLEDGQLRDFVVELGRHPRPGARIRGF